MTAWPRLSPSKWFTSPVREGSRNPHHQSTGGPQATTAYPTIYHQGMRVRPIVCLLASAMVLLTGCSALLPSAKDETVAPWQKFEEAKAAYDQIALGNSRAELKKLGFEVDNSPNIQVLSYLDVADKIDTIPMTQLDAGLQECLQRRDGCQAYVIDLRHLRSKRTGGFWADFFNFKRNTDTTGWRFNALLVVIDDRVTYKLWSGTPKVEIYEEKRNPLGPLQSFDSMTMGLLPW